MKFWNIFGGRNMSALAVAASAPDFKLQNLDGQAFWLNDALSRGPVVAAFFKVACPVCQYAFPFLERIHKAHPDLTIVGISQNDSKDTAAFVRQFGVTFPVLLDDMKAYEVSNAYGLTTVPTIFWIAQDSKIEISSVGWVRAEIEDLNRKASAPSGFSKSLFTPGEKIADFRAG